VNDAAERWRDAMRERDRGKVDKAVKRILTDAEIKDRLKLTEAQLDVLDDIFVNPKRYSGIQLLALKLKLMATVEPPEQKIGGDIGIQVVVNTLKRADYEVPATATATRQIGMTAEPQMPVGKKE
jgi:hypothetical protein